MSSDYQKDLQEAAKERNHAQMEAEKDYLDTEREAGAKLAKAEEKADSEYGKAAAKAADERASAIEDAAKDARKAEADAMNRDPITGAPGSHPLGTGVGTTGGMIAGAAAGSLAGPVGTAVGGVIGAIVGAAAGHDVGEVVNPTAEETYWQSAYTREPYYNPMYTYDDYAPAYRYGFQTLGKSGSQIWEEQQDAELRREWERNRGASQLKWDDARYASLAAWNRVNERRTS